MFTPWPVAQVATERRRLTVLQYLAVTPGFEAAAMILRDRCREIGVPTHDDQILSCVHWLSEQALVTVRQIGNEPIARITAMGRDVSQGFRTHPGVMQPDP